METFLSILATILALFSIIMISIQSRLLRKDLQTRNYQDLITRLFSARDSMINIPELSSIWDKHPELDLIKEEVGISVQDFFWILKYLTSWENFYYQRQQGVMEEQTWIAYVNTVELVFKAPKIYSFWEKWRRYGSYRRDWINFVNTICTGEKPKDPILPRWKRFLGT